MCEVKLQHGNGFHKPVRSTGDVHVVGDEFPVGRVRGRLGHKVERHLEQHLQRLQQTPVFVDVPLGLIATAISQRARE